MSRQFNYTIGEEAAGERVDRFLAGCEEMEILGLTRSMVQKMVKNGAVSIGGRVVKANHNLKVGEKVRFTVPSSEESALKAENIPLDVIYEDSEVIVVNKPAGMVVHPVDSGDHQSGTLVNALLYHCKDLSGIGGIRRPGIVHRLDKGTSGVMIVAKNDRAHHDLSGQIKDRKVKKVYLALVRGRLEPEHGSIEAPIGRSVVDRKKMAVREGGNARDALTHYDVERYLEFPEIGVCSLVKVTIVTGRTHQIRVHFQSIGFPVVGDEVYGDRKVNRYFAKHGLKRPFLHAWRLGVRLPSSGCGEGEFKEFVAGLPEELGRVI